MSERGSGNQTAMMRQWTAIKREHRDCVVLFRLGDFYEAFNEDAARLAEVCDVTLTSRPVSKGMRIPMAGVPYHAVDGYIAQLVRAGVKVAIAEQVGPDGAPNKRARMSRSPGKAVAEPVDAGRTIIRRDVVRVVTPGTLVEGDLLEAGANNYLVGLLEVAHGGTGYQAAVGLAYVDISTGEFAVTELRGAGAERSALDEIARLRPAEVLLATDLDSGSDAEADRLRARVGELGLDVLVAPYPRWRFERENARRTLLDHFGVLSLQAFGCDGLDAAVGAAGAVLEYVRETESGALGQIAGLTTYSQEAYMTLDAATRRNLELTAAMRTGKRAGSLLWVIDRTRTPMGGRQLRRWLEQPLRVRAAISTRLDAVEALSGGGSERAALREALGRVPDLERLINRVSAGYAGPRELVRLAEGLEGLDEVARRAAQLSPGAGRYPELADPAIAAAASAVREAIIDDPPAGLGDGGVIRPGFDVQLDEINASVVDAREWIAGLEARERAATGIAKIKVGFNKVFGYYLAVPKRSADAVPADWVRKQTLVDSERYITPDLKERESEVLHAEERIAARERELYARLVDAVSGDSAALLEAARATGRRDALAGLAATAEAENYVRPLLDESRALDIDGGRHPVVERMLQGSSFVPNDLRLGEGEIALLTGPNMAGKSTVGRQAALIALLAQIGSFVPAKSARIGLVDRIFTRIGAQDEISAGHSTFMVEMVETAALLHHATPRSLLILDELGRGTSTYDGIAIAWSVLEHIHNSAGLGCRTVFATHYHELTALADALPRVRNYNMAVDDRDGAIVFLHRVEPGSADRSYGVHVAELAGLPAAVTRRAWEILERLEAEGNVPLQAAATRPPAGKAGQLPLFTPTEAEHPAVRALRGLDPGRMTPIEALTKLIELRSLAADRRR